MSYIYPAICGVLVGKLALAIFGSPAIATAVALALIWGAVWVLK